MTRERLKELATEAMQIVSPHTTGYSGKYDHLATALYYALVAMEQAQERELNGQDERSGQ